MRNMVSNYYDLMTFGFGNMSFQQFVDKIKNKLTVSPGITRSRLITPTSS